jgi:hydroxylamine dehydrogenase
MSARAQRIVLLVVSLGLVGSLLLVQLREILRLRQQSASGARALVVPARSRRCVECHAEQNPGVVEPWRTSVHAEQGVACVDCHTADRARADSYEHYGERIVTAVTPRDCGRCHAAEANDFARSAHARAADVELKGRGSLLGSLAAEVTGAAAAVVGCARCHGTDLTLLGTAGERLGVGELAPDAEGRATSRDALARVARDADGFPLLASDTWPNAGIGRRNLDGSLGACSACHARHDFSRGWARRSETCTVCHQGEDQPEREIVEASRHGMAYRLLAPRLGLEGVSWVLGRDYAAAPSCATCHLSGHVRNGGTMTHDPASRLSWSLRGPVGVRRDTDATGRLVSDANDDKRRAATVDSSEDKRQRMRAVCIECHAVRTVDASYQQLDAQIALYDEKLGQPTETLMAALLDAGLRTERVFDEPLEWSWFELRHRAGRRARLGAAMLSPDDAMGRGMSRAAEHFYRELVPQARALAREAARSGKKDEAAAVDAVLDRILAQPAHAWLGRASASR